MLYSPQEIVLVILGLLFQVALAVAYFPIFKGYFLRQDWRGLAISLIVYAISFFTLDFALDNLQGWIF